jgi:hypothetical protein
MLQRSFRLMARRSPTAPVVFSAASTVPRADEIDRFPLRERQESFLIENLPKTFSDAVEIAALTGISAEKILLMRTRIGEFTGRALLLAGPDTLLAAPLPAGASMRPMDVNDTELFVEQCERLHAFTDDIRRLAEEAKNDGFNRIVTLTGVPKSYSRADVQALISDATKGSVSIKNERDIVFRFKRNGYQSDTCFVLLPTADDALQVLKTVQEFAVPQRRVYGTSFGCSFVHADRSAVFITDESLDYILDGCKYWVMTLGWNTELDEAGIRAVLDRMAIYPNKIVKVTGGGGGEFLLRFDRMKNAKLVFSRLHRLKRRWRIPQHTAFFAYPVRADMHFAGDAKHADEASDCDSDLDEPVMY